MLASKMLESSPMADARLLQIPKPLFAFIGGVVLFGAGLAVLHLNPYWRVEPGSGGYLDHHVYLWNGVGHLINAVGILLVFATAAITLITRASIYFTTKWLYWGGVVVIVGLVALWLLFTGISARYIARFHWESGVGITHLVVVNKDKVTSGMSLWQAIVRWQIEPELDGYLGSGQNLQSTDCDSSVTVLKVVPIAVPTALGSGGETLRKTQFRRR